MNVHAIDDLRAARKDLGIPENGNVNGRGSIAERAAGGEAAMSPRVDPQDGLFDIVLDNEPLERALEHRQVAKDALKPKKKEYESAAEAVKGLVENMIDELELQDLEEGEEQTFRCGRFRIKRAYRSGNSVSFETSPSTRTTISLVSDD